MTDFKTDGSLWAEMIINPIGVSGWTLERGLIDKLFEEGLLDQDILNSFVTIKDTWSGSMMDVRVKEGDQISLWLAWLYRQDGMDRQPSVEWIVEKIEKGYIDPLQGVIFDSEDKQEKIRGIDMIFHLGQSKDIDRVLKTLKNDQIKNLINDAHTPSSKKISITGCVYRNKIADILDVLIAYGWDIDEKDTKGQTGLIKSRKWGRAKSFLDRGADVFQKDNLGRDVSARAVLWAKDLKHLKGINSYLNNIKKIQSKQNNKPIVNKYTPEVDKICEELFQMITAGAVGDTKLLLGRLKKIENKSKMPLLDDRGQTIGYAAVSKAMSSGDDILKRGTFGVCPNVSLRRLKYNLISSFKNDKNENSWFKLNHIPNKKLPNWTEEDHLMCATLFSTKIPTSTLIKDQDLYAKREKLWMEDRFDKLLPEIVSWHKQFIASPQDRYISILEVLTRDIKDEDVMEREFRKIWEDADFKDTWLINIILDMNDREILWRGKNDTGIEKDDSSHFSSSYCLNPLLLEKLTNKHSQVPQENKDVMQCVLFKEWICLTLENMEAYEDEFSFDYWKKIEGVIDFENAGPLLKEEVNLFNKWFFDKRDNNYYSEKTLKEHISNNQIEDGQNVKKEMMILLEKRCIEMALLDTMKDKETTRKKKII